jgi:quercetin dioxygenase-like cupin family protein
MRYPTKYFLCIIVVFGMACTQNQTHVVDGFPLFPQGSKNKSDNFMGDVWVKSLINADSLNETTVGNVTFAPGARSNWHSHPAGQIILVTEGIGYYQEKGKAKIILRKGDVIKCPPNIPHWHGASPETKFVQIAISSRKKGPAVWLAPVTNSVYLAK